MNQHPELTGAQILVRELERLGVTHIFGYPGGAAINIFDALYDSKIKVVLTRHEQGAVHMADGFARATGQIGVVLVTSGPGALNTVTGLLTAKMDSVPIVVISGQTNSHNLGKDAFQEADVFGVTMPVVKHNRLILGVEDVAPAVAEAFDVAKEGRPGPVLLDLPKDISGKKCIYKPRIQGAIKEASLSDPQRAQCAGIAALIRQSKRPLLLVGHGAILSGASELVIRLAETINAPVVNTLLGKGAFPESHPLSLGMLGMHGNAYANYATTRCDLILSIGSRFDDRINGLTEKFCPLAKKAHIDIDAAEIGKVVTPDAWAQADAKLALKEILHLVSPLETSEWLTELDSYRSEFPLCSKPDDDKGELRAAEVLDVLNSLLEDNAVITTDVGQHQMWAAQFMLSKKARTFLSSGGAGTMGFGVPSAIGAQFALPDRTVVAIVGDGGFQMTQCELATAFIHKLPVKFLILDNKCLGMVRQWQELFYENRLSSVLLDGNPDFVALAHAYGIKGVVLEDRATLRENLASALRDESGPILIHAKVALEDNVWPMIPAGRSADDIVLARPTNTLEKPTGST